MSAFLDTSLGKWIGVLIVVLSGTFAQSMMKMGTHQVGAFGDAPFLQYLLKLLFSPLILLAIIAYGFGVIWYMFMISRLELSFLYPIMTSLGLVTVSIVSATLFQEQISWIRLGGIAVMIVGVFLVSKG
jgi:multidrug transporter EmrE-like cation transporter